jgi:lipoate---protein ligase
MSIRLIDAGTVSYLRSQTVYHGAAYARTEKTPDTIILVSPQEPYVCIGFHQELEKEVEVDFCRQNGIPVVRREVGGGAVYLDHNQLFTQWVMRPDRLPWQLEKRFTLYAQPLVETYHALGINANFRPINDIQVSGKKIGGTGAAAIGNAEVVVGSLMFDFNTALMAKVLKVPSEKFRDKVYQSLQEYMTTMKKELGAIPDRERVKEIYRRECEKALGEKIEAGEFTDAELIAIESLDTKFASEEWLHQKGGLKRTGVKIHQDVWVGESTFKARGGLIRVTARLNQNRLEDISISGDFTFHPHNRVAELEQALFDVELSEAAVTHAVSDFYQQSNIQTPGVEIQDWQQAIMGLKTAV